MKKLAMLVLTLILFESIPPANSQIKDTQLDWASLQEAFKTYAEYPSSENAMKIVEILPDRHVTYTGSKQEKEAFDFIYNREQFGMLERHVFSRDRVAVKLAFKLRSIADGGFLEDLNIMLGTLIRIDPKLFLEELSSAKPEVQQLDHLLANQGAIYVDRLKAKILECELRIQSLQTISDPKLIELRNDCIIELKSHKEFLIETAT